jgi:hypothetical protein
MNSSGIQLHRQMTGRHTPSILQYLWRTSGNYLVLSSIIFNKVSVSTLMVVKRPPIREDLKVLLYQSQEADNTFITSDGTSPYNSTR